jgi:CheY-specific phosphatase CheX
MLDGKIINVLTLGVLATVKSFSDINLVKNAVYLLKGEMEVKWFGIKIPIAGDFNGHIITFFDEGIKNKLEEDFSKLLDRSKDENIHKNAADNINLSNSILSEISNTISGRISAYFSQINVKADIGIPEIIDPSKTKELNYENIAIIDFKSDYGYFKIVLGLKEIKYERNLTFALYGLKPQTIEYITTNFIPRGFEVVASDDLKLLAYYVKNKKIDFFLVDFYTIENNPESFILSLTSNIDYNLKFILGVTKVDLEKLKNIKLTGPNYSVIGIYPKTKSDQDLIETVNKILQKVGLNPDDRRKFIRVNINEQSRFFIAFKEGERLVKARIVDLSLGGAKCVFDNEQDINIVWVGRVLRSVDIFLKYNRVIADCSVVYKEGNIFSLCFNNLSNTDKETISLVIFKVLSSSI